MLARHSWREPGLAYNLCSASIVAVDLSTGNPVWHFQECTKTFGTTTAHNPPSYSRSKKMESIFRALGHCAKTGQYFILDRRNGPAHLPGD